MHQIIFLFLLVIISPQSSSLYAQLFGGQIIPPSLESSYPLGSVFCASGPTQIVEVLNPVTGRIWMDRNLGASRAAISSTDALAYGDLYQWGRRSDGHQCLNSPTINILSSTDQPNHGNFILSPASPYDWRSPQNSGLWQGINGINNPCPNGYRIPTYAELNSELSSWTTANALGAFNSPLKFPSPGIREYFTGGMVGVGGGGFIWSSWGFLSNSESLDINGAMNSNRRATGQSVRCIKN